MEANGMEGWRVVACEDECQKNGVLLFVFVIRKGFSKDPNEQNTHKVLCTGPDNNVSTLFLFFNFARFISYFLCFYCTVVKTLLLARPTADSLSSSDPETELTATLLTSLLRLCSLSRACLV